MNCLKATLTLTALLLASTPQARAGDDDLFRQQSQLNALIQQNIDRLGYLQKNASKCTRYSAQLNSLLLKPFSEKFADYKETLGDQLKELRANLVSAPGTFESVNACVGYKATANTDFKAKQAELQRVRAALAKEITRELQKDTNKLYYETQKALLGMTGHGAAVKALAPEASWPDCSPNVLATFRSFAEPGSPRASLNVFLDKMKELDVYLAGRSAEIGKAIAAINKTECGSVTAAAAAPEVKRDPPVAAAAAPEVTKEPPVVAAAAPELKRDPPVVAAPGSAPVVGSILAEQERSLASAARTPEALTENDKWKAPADWKKYDEYKASINAPNKVAGVNLGQHYTQFLSSNSVQVRSEEDALRLQKAINAASIQVNGYDGVGVSVYQDGRVGSRTMSAAYMMQNDPVYRPVFLAELRKQGLIRY